MKGTVSHANAEATIKSMILDGLIKNTLHPLPDAERMVSDIYESISSPQVNWALPIIAGLEEAQLEGLTDEEIKKHGYGWMQNYDYEIKELIQATIDKIKQQGTIYRRKQ